MPLRGSRSGPERRPRSGVAPSGPDPATASDRRADPWELTGVLVLSGGRSSRFEGDKITARLGGLTVLEHVLAGLPDGPPVVLVGSRPDGLERAGLVLTREEPPGGGPVAGLAAGCAVLPSVIRTVLVLAGDQPFSAGAGGRLLAALSAGRAGEPAGGKRPQAAVGVDPDGRWQPLLAAYRVRPLRRAIGPRPAGRRMRDVLAGLRALPVPVTAREALDVDTREDLERAHRLM